MFPDNIHIFHRNQNQTRGRSYHSRRAAENPKPCPLKPRAVGQFFVLLFYADDL